MKALLVILALASVARAGEVKCVAQKVPASKKTTLAFPDGKKIRIDVVDTPQSREIGLMCVTKMSHNYGMLFAFNQDMFLNFWMKNTLVPLDIIWISADKTITVIAPKLHESTVDTPDEKVVTAGGKGQFVLELRSGEAALRKLKVGDKLDFTVAIPEK